MAVREKLWSLSRMVESLLTSLSNLLMIGVTIMIFSEVVNRFWFQQSYGFLEEIATWMQVWFVCLAIGLITKSGGHIAVEFLPSKLSERRKKVWLVVADVVTLIFASVLFWSGVEMCQKARELGVLSVSGIPVPIWVIKLCIPVGGILTAFFAIGKLVLDIGCLNKSTKGGK